MATPLFLMVFLIGYCLVVALLLLQLGAAPAEDKPIPTYHLRPGDLEPADRDAA